VAAQDLVLPAGPGRSIQVKRNSILAVSPFLTHRDTQLFPDAPGAFWPQRYQKNSKRNSNTGSARGGVGRHAADGDGAVALGATDADMGRDRVEAGDGLGCVPGVAPSGMAFGGGRFRCGF